MEIPSLLNFLKSGDGTIRCSQRKIPRSSSRSTFQQRKEKRTESHLENQPPIADATTIALLHLRMLIFFCTLFCILIVTIYEIKVFNCKFSLCLCEIDEIRVELLL